MRNSAFLAIAAVGALVGYNASAQGPVYSVNIVGFQKVTASNSFTQVSNPFVQTSTTINDVVGNQGDGGTDFSNSDVILSWNGVAYDTFFLANTGGAAPEFDGKWLELDGNGDPVVSTFPLPPGKGFWFQNQGATNTITMVGDVESSATKTVALNQGFNLVSYPYSTTVGINSTQMNLNLNSNGSGANPQGGTDLSNSDLIFIWNGAAYDTLFLVNFPDAAELHNKWVYLDGNGDPQVSSLVINPGTSFWYQRIGSGNVSWTTTKPY